MEKFDIYKIADKAYSVIKGGSYGKVRYFSVYKKVTEYVNNHYKDAKCSDIVKTKDGWSCIVSKDSKNLILYITKTDTGDLSFWEQPI